MTIIANFVKILILDEALLFENAMKFIFKEFHDNSQSATSPQINEFIRILKSDFKVPPNRFSKKNNQWNLSLENDDTFFAAVSKFEPQKYFLFHKVGTLYPLAVLDKNKSLLILNTKLLKSIQKNIHSDLETFELEYQFKPEVVNLNEILLSLRKQEQASENKKTLPEIAASVIKKIEQNEDKNVVNLAELILDKNLLEIVKKVLDIEKKKIKEAKKLVDDIKNDLEQCAIGDIRRIILNHGSTSIEDVSAEMDKLKFQQNMVNAFDNFFSQTEHEQENLAEYINAIREALKTFTLNKKYASCIEDQESNDAQKLLSLIEANEYECLLDYLIYIIDNSKQAIESYNVLRNKKNLSMEDIDSIQQADIQKAKKLLVLISQKEKECEARNKIKKNLEMYSNIRYLLRVYAIERTLEDKNYRTYIGYFLSFFSNSIYSQKEKLEAAEALYQKHSLTKRQVEILNKGQLKEILFDFTYEAILEGGLSKVYSSEEEITIEFILQQLGYTRDSVNKHYFNASVSQEKQRDEAIEGNFSEDSFLTNYDYDEGSGINMAVLNLLAQNDSNDTSQRLGKSGIDFLTLSMLKERNNFVFYYFEENPQSANSAQIEAFAKILQERFNLKNKIYRENENWVLEFAEDDELNIFEVKTSTKKPHKKWLFHKTGSLWPVAEMDDECLKLDIELLQSFIDELDFHRLTYTDPDVSTVIVSHNEFTQSELRAKLLNRVRNYLREYVILSLLDEKEDPNTVWTLIFRRYYHSKSQKINAANALFKEGSLTFQQIIILKAYPLLKDCLLKALSDHVFYKELSDVYKEKGLTIDILFAELGYKQDSKNKSQLTISIPGAGESENEISDDENRIVHPESESFDEIPLDNEVVSDPPQQSRSIMSVPSKEAQQYRRLKDIGDNPLSNEVITDGKGNILPTSDKKLIRKKFLEEGRPNIRFDSTPLKTYWHARSWAWWNSNENRIPSVDSSPGASFSDESFQAEEQDTSQFNCQRVAKK